MIACVYNTAQVMAVELVVRIAHFFLLMINQSPFIKALAILKSCMVVVFVTNLIKSFSIKDGRGK